MRCLPGKHVYGFEAVVHEDSGEDGCIRTILTMYCCRICGKPKYEEIESGSKEDMKNKFKTHSKPDI